MLDHLHNRPQRESSALLRLAAISSFILFACNFIGGILPLRLIDPAWQLNAIQSLHSLTFLPLVGICLLLVSIDVSGSGSSNRPVWLSRSCAAASIGFLLLIPLQATAIWRVGVLTEIPANRTIATIVAARSEIASSGDLSELGNALAKLPGAPKLPPGFNQPLALVRQNMEQKLGTDLEKLRADQQQRLAQRRLPELALFVRSLVLSAVFVVFFGAIAGFQFPPLNINPQLLNPFKKLSKLQESWNLRRAAKSRAYILSGQPGPVSSMLKRLKNQLNQRQLSANARRLAARQAESRQSRRR